MSLGSGPTFSCGSCGRKYPWKPALAGRRAKCKCGQVIEVPAQLAAEPPPDPEPDLDLFDVGAPAGAGDDLPPLPANAAAAQQAAATCPSCQSPMSPGAPICMACGFDTRTGRHIRTQVEAGEVPARRATAAASSAAAPAGKVLPYRSPRRGEASAADGSRNVKQLVLIGLGVVALAGLIFGARLLLKDRGSAVASAGPTLGDDAAALRMLKEDAPIEARKFINDHESRSLGTQWTRRVALARIDQWYEMGAVKVWAFTGLISKEVLLELPQDPEKRARLFDWAARWETEKMHKAPTDVGQKYIILHMM